MRWLRFIALLIFAFVTAYRIPFAYKNPNLSNIVITLIFVVITVWVASGFFKKPKQTAQYQ